MILIPMKIYQINKNSYDLRLKIDVDKEYVRKETTY